MTKNEALAICFANLKGSKDKDLLGTAQALAFLKSLPEYRTNKKVGAAVGVSGEMVRQFLDLLELPEDVQRLLRSNVLRLEHGRRLRQLSRSRPEIVYEAAAAMFDMTAMDARNLVDFLGRYPEMPLDDIKRAINESKTIKAREYHVVAFLSEDDYSRLVSDARSEGRPLDYLVTSIVQEWLNKELGNDG